MEGKHRCHILMLSDYSLLNIFYFLPANDLYSLSLTCSRFEDLINDRSLWIYIDARNDSNTKVMVKFYTERIWEHTEHFCLAGPRRDLEVLPQNFFNERKYEHLTVLALENQTLTGDMANLSQYPEGLEELSLRKSFVHGHNTFFKFTDRYMKRLRVLILDECGWVETYMLVPFSKYPRLEVLSLYKCKKLSDNDIAYISMAGCIGFENLKILDVRFTGLGDQIIKSFYQHQSLQELYFQCYNTTYVLDRTKRHLEIARGSPTKSDAYLSPYDNIPDTDQDEMQKLFGQHYYKNFRNQNLTDDGTVMFKGVCQLYDDIMIWTPFLYKSPYGQCKCDQRKKSPIKKGKSIPKNRDEINRLEEIIRKETGKKMAPHTYMLQPKFSLNYFERRPSGGGASQSPGGDGDVAWLMQREPRDLHEIALFEHTDVHCMESEVIIPCELKGGRLEVGKPIRACPKLLGHSESQLGISNQSSSVEKANDSTSRAQPQPQGKNPASKPEDEFSKPGCSGSNNIPKPPLQNGEEKCILCCTYAALENDLCEKCRRLEESDFDSDDHDDRLSKSDENDDDDDDDEGRPVAGLKRSADAPALSNSKKFKSYNDLEYLGRILGMVDYPVDLDELIQRTRLMKISLRGFPGVTDKSLQYLGPLNLELLDVTMTGVSPQGVLEFCQKYPQCRVLHETACTCPVDMRF